MIPLDELSGADLAARAGGTLPLDVDREIEQFDDTLLGGWWRITPAAAGERVLSRR